ncbi:MAG: hypothetical protein ABIN20_00370 [candidate division WOR-3 bacterium]
MNERSKYIEAVKKIFESYKINYREEIISNMFLVKNDGLWIVVSGKEGEKIKNLTALLRKNLLPYLILYNSLKEETYICDLGNEYKGKKFKTINYDFYKLKDNWWILTNLWVVIENVLKTQKISIFLPSSKQKDELNNYKNHNLIVKVCDIKVSRYTRFSTFTLLYKDIPHYSVIFELESIFGNFKYENGFIKMIPSNEKLLTTDFIFELEIFFKLLSKFINKNKGFVGLGEVIYTAFKENQLKKKLITKRELLEYLGVVLKMDLKGLMEFIKKEKSLKNKIKRIKEEIKNGLFINMYKYGGSYGV